MVVTQVEFHQNLWHPKPCSIDYVTVSSVVFGRPFVKLFALCYRTVVCLSVLYVTLVYCGKTVGWFKMKLGMEVGLDHIVLDGNPAPIP